MIYEFGPDAPIVKAIGGEWPIQALGDDPGLDPAVLVAFLGHGRPGAVVGFVLNFTPWGRHLYAIGGNEHAARLTGVPVDRIKFQAYMFSAFTAAIAVAPARSATTARRSTRWARATSCA